MGKHCLLLSLLTLSLLVGCHASVSLKAYWKLKLPNTPMPDPIKDYLPVAAGDQSAVKLGRKELHPSTIGSPSGTTTYGGFLLSDTRESLTPIGTAYSPGLLCTKGSLTTTVKDLSSKQEIASPSSNVQDSDDLASHFFFLEKHLDIGTKMNLEFKKGIMKALFLPRDVANTIPFSSNKLQETVQFFSLDPKSEKASILKRRIDFCEEPTTKGVEKQCVSSLESMVDFVTSKIGKNVKAMSTKVGKEVDMMEFTITRVDKLTNDNHETAACHKLDYPYALFFCHTTNSIRSYKVSLVGKDGTNMEAIAACHKETNAFLENYEIKVLNIKPGSTHVCHFPPAEDSIIWVRN